MIDIIKHSEEKVSLVATPEERIEDVCKGLRRMDGMTSWVPDSCGFKTEANGTFYFTQRYRKV